MKLLLLSCFLHTFSFLTTHSNLFDFMSHFLCHLTYFLIKSMSYIPHISTSASSSSLKINFFNCSIYSIHVKDTSKHVLSHPQAIYTVFMFVNSTSTGPPAANQRQAALCRPKGSRHTRHSIKGCH